MKEIFNGSVCNFGSYSSIWVTIKYEKKRNAADMQYRFNYKIRLSNRSGGSSSSAYYENNVQGKFYLNNVNVYTKSVKSSNKDWSFEYTTEWFNVENKTSGTVPFKFTIKDTQNSSWCNYSSSTYQLEIDPAGSDFNTLSNFNIGQPFTITTNKYNEEFYDKLVIKLGETILKTLDNIETSVLIDFTTEELNTIYSLTTEAQYADFAFEISSFEDEEMTIQIGITNSSVVKGYIIASNPIITSKSAIDTNDTTIALTGDNTKLIKGHSNVKVNVVAEGQNQATIKAITVNNELAENGIITFDKITSNVFNIIITDSRGFQTTDIITLDMVDYLNITLNVNISRNEPTDSKVKINYSGNCFNGDFGVVNNTLNVQYRFKEKGQEFTNEDKWIDMTPTLNDNNTFQENNFIVDDVDYKKVYVFQVYAFDKLTEWPIIETTIKKGKPSVHIGEDFLNVYGDIEQNGQNINEIYAGLELTGNLEDLNTQIKSNLVNAINDINSRKKDIEEKSIIMASITSNKSISVTEAWDTDTYKLEKVNFQKGEKLTLNTSDGRIYYTGNKALKVTHHIFRNGGSSGNIYPVSNISAYYQEFATDNSAFATAIHFTEAREYIEARIRSSAKGTSILTGNATSPYTYMIVEELD